MHMLKRIISKPKLKTGGTTVRLGKTKAANGGSKGGKK
jgi:hypothetical protein